MRDLSSPTVMGLLVAIVLVTACRAASASDILPQASAQSSGRCSDSVVESQETLSALGIDFGAAELLRYTELDLNGRQKKRALSVVSDCRPAIDRLCDRMTNALRMDESTAQAKAVKKAELEAVVKRFQRVQSEIISGLHALITPDQRARLQAIKQHESDGGPSPKSAKPS